MGYWEEGRAGQELRGMGGKGDAESRHGREGGIHHSIDILFSGGELRYYYCGGLLRFVAGKGGKLL
jgi:hypothetical protein